MNSSEFMSKLLQQLREVSTRLDKLEDRVDIVEERGICHENRLEELEEWQEKTDDKLDKEL